ncbi:MAG: hypothetical protein QOH56_855 [Pseudonocardiales bacterium]|jgi:hypothetical protein|nr:hypothetical protein [Pseudonocardiales bacterium]
MSGEATVGSIVGYLRLDDSDWRITIDAAKAKAAELGKSDPTIKVQVESTKALSTIAEINLAVKAASKDKLKIDTEVNADKSLAEIAKLKAEAMALSVAFARSQHEASMSIDKLGSSLQQGGNNVSRLKNAITDTGRAVSRDAGDMAKGLGQISPIAYAVAAGVTLIGPAAGVATAGAVGLAGALGVAALAYKGFQTQIKDGTPIGLQLQSSIKGISSEVQHIEAIASTGASGGVLGSFKQVKDFLPTLEPIVARLSQHLGAALNTGTGGLIKGLQTASPLLDDAGHYAEVLAQKISDFAGSPEFARFINYARQELPIVAHDMLDIGTAAVHIATTLQPIGDGLLTIADYAAKAADGITRVLNAASTSSPSKPGKDSSILSRIGSTLETLFVGDTTGTGGAAGAKKRSAANKPPAAAVPETVVQVQERINASYQTTADKLGIAVTASQQYSSMVGITAAAVGKGTVNQNQLNTSVAGVKAAYDSASSSGTAYLTALSAFSASQGTAADRASLIGATLKAANGDALSYAAAIANTTVASHALATSFEQQNLTVSDLQFKIKSGKLNTQQMKDAQFSLAAALSVSEKAAINLKTGVIDLAKDGAAPLVTQLQAIQDAATAAASATYQHEKATKGGTIAADDAFNVYVKQTKGALLDQAAKLGLTATQAGKLADQYFGIKNSGDIKKKIEQEGGGTVISVLQSIKGILEILAGLKPKPVLSVKDNLTPVAQNAKNKLDALNGMRVTTYIDTITTAPKTNAAAGGSGRSVNVPAARASGGSLPEGYSTIDEQGWELLHKQGNQVQVIPHEQAKKMLPQGPAVPAFASGTKGATVKQVPQGIIATAGGGAAYGIATVIKGQIGEAKTAMAELSKAVNEAFQLKGVQSQMTSIKTALTNLQTASNSLRSGVTSTLAGTVDPTKYTSVSDLIGAFSTGTANNQHFTASEHAASAKGANKSLLAQLAASGNSAGLDTLAGASKGEIAMLNKQFLAYQGSAGAGGLTASNDVYGAQIKADQARYAKLGEEAARDRALIAHSIAVIGKMTNKPVEVKLDGKVIGHAVISGGEFQGVLDNLTHQLLFGRH